MSPTYDFQCPQCSTVTEVYRSFTDETPAPQCEHCSVEMAKKFHATPAIFNGTGWAKVPKL